MDRVPDCSQELNTFLGDKRTKADSLRLSLSPVSFIWRSSPGHKHSKTKLLAAERHRSRGLRFFLFISWGQLSSRLH